jgi:hypothetical protein
MKRFQYRSKPFCLEITEAIHPPDGYRCPICKRHGTLAVKAALVGFNPDHYCLECVQKFLEQAFYDNPKAVWDEMTDEEVAERGSEYRTVSDVLGLAGR